MTTRMRQKVGKSKKKWYVVRDKKGRIRDVQNIGRSIRMDAARKSKHKVKKRGKGHTGDY